MDAESPIALPIRNIESSTRRVLRMAAAIFVAALVSSSGQETPHAEFPAGIRLPASARGEAAIAALGNRLPEVASHYRKAPEELRALFRNDKCLQVNTEGKLFYACELHGHAATAAEAPSATVSPTDPPPFPTEEAFLLHSRPGANRLIYLDFDGHIDNTAGNWRDGASAPPFDTNGDPSVFTSSERERIIYIWQRVAEDFSMFDIDVTTEDPGVEALRKTNSSDQIYGIRVVIGGSSGGADDWYTSSVGGVAFVGSFDSSSDVPCWVFPGNLGNSEKNIAEAASHEAGHTLGLSHDGVTGGASYYSGQGNWAPIMGVGYSKEIVQWSKGEYSNANNTQDDLAVMLTQGAVYRPDDHGSTTTTATVLSADTIPLLSEGVIEKRTDLDFFRISAAGGSLGITVKPSPRDSNLRIEVKLYDAAGTLLQTASSADTTSGTQPVTLTRSVALGDYFFSVDGIGNGDPLATGYSDYASLGQYLISITGVIPAGATWLPTAAGTYQWNTSSNWSTNPLPNAAGVTLRINNNIAANQTINLTTAATLGNLFLGDSNGTHRFTIAAAGGSLTFDNGAASEGLSKTSGSNDVISAPLALTGELLVNQSSSGTLSLSGAVSGTGSLTKEGAGTLILTGAKTYTGPTIVDDGVLRLDTTDALPAGNLVLSGGGVLGLASGNFSRANGTGSNQVQWNGNGGFAAFGADRTVTPGSMSWASTTLSGNALILGHATADATLIWSSNLSFAGSARIIQVDDGSAAIDARISGVLSGSGTFNKTGSGTLELTNANTYTAATSVNDGLLLLSNAAALPATNLAIGGGILGLGAGDLTTRTIGTGASQVQWTADGGFAAFGATRAVKFSETAINWTATNFIGGGRTLILSHPTADATLDWQQPISMNGGARTVEVGNGTAEIDALMSGVINGGTAGNAPFSKTGEGTLAFTAQNSYNGDTIVTAGILMIGNGGTTGGISQNSTNIIVDSGATLAVNRSDTVTQGSNPLKVAISGDGDFAQIGSGTTILNLVNTHTGGTAIDRGTLKLSGSGTLGAAGSTVSVSSAGLLDLNGTNQSIKFTAGSGVGMVANNSGSGTSTLTLAGTATINGSHVTISDSTTTPGGKVAIVIQANTQPLSNLNTYSGGTTVNAGAFLYLNSANPNGAGTGTIHLTALGAGGSTSSGLVVDGTTYANNITGAGYVHNNSTGASTTVLTGNLNTSGPFIFRAGTGIVYDFAGNGTTSTLSGLIGSTTSMVNGAVATGSIRKSGTGTLTLSGANIYTGSTTVSGGILNLTGNRSASAGGITVGNLNGSTGTLNVSNGTFQTGTVTVGAGNGTARGIVNQSGGTLTLTGNQLLLGNLGIAGALAGNGGNGTYHLSGGTLTATAVANRGVILGTNDGGTSTFNLSGTGNLILTGVSQLMVGRSDSPVVNTTNVFNQTGGTASVTILSIGGAAAAATGLNSTFSVTGGTFSASNFTSLGVGNSGMVTMNIGGSADVTLPAFPTVRGSGTTATIHFNGGTLKPLAASPTYMGGLTAAYVKSGGARFDTTNGSITITQSLLTDGSSFNGGLTKAGPNTLTLTGVNTYTGNTLISGGTLALGDNAQLKFVIGTASGSNNKLTGTGTVIIDGDFNIDTTLTDASALTSGSWTLVDAATLSETFGITFSLAGGGWSETANVWTKTVGNKKYTFTEANSILTMTLFGYSLWAATHAPTGTAADDFDGDGVANGIEYVLGGSSATKDAARLPQISSSGGNVIFTFIRDQASIDGTTTLAIETGTDLTTWPINYVVPAGAVFSNPGLTVVKNTPSAGKDTVTLTLPTTSSSLRFARMKVVP
jgi:autotransporter-associated beta strand protein